MRIQIFPEKGVVYPGRRRRWYVRLVGENGETLFVSQAYAQKWNAKRAAHRLWPVIGIEIEEVPS